MDSRQRPVAIFWDFENCPLPNTAGVCEVDKIRRIAQEYGPIKVFKAYLELYEQCSAKTLSLRSELQSCGVTLTDCPHNGRKDVADKMMLVDMMTFAMDNEAPATVIVLSGDRDFVYAISTLRLRGYHVVVIAPKQGHINLRYRASEVLDWDVLVLQGGHTHSRRSSDATVPPPSSEASQGTRESTYASSSTSTALLSPLPKLANGQSFVDDWNATLARPSRARTTSVTHPASASDKEGSTTCTVNGCTPADRCLILDLGPSKSAVPEVEDVLMSAKSSTLSEGESELSTAVNMSSAVEVCVQHWLKKRIYRVHVSCR
ncbi:NYN domain-containing protein [Cytidiella melzeri]|nr:NYN domain-containing protein [Cytidiella melzeri]